MAALARCFTNQSSASMVFKMKLSLPFTGRLLIGDGGLLSACSLLSIVLFEVDNGALSLLE